MPADLHNPSQDKNREPLDRYGAFAVLKKPSSRVLIAFAVFLFFACIAYALHQQGFDSPMIYDARGWIQNKANIYGQHQLKEVIGIVPARPLFMVTLYVNYLVSGMDPSAFRMTNALILAATGLALVFLSIAMFEATHRSSGDRKLATYGVCGFLGLLFVVHPLQTFAVLYIWQREAILASFFFYSALAVYIGGRSGKLGDRTGPYILTGILFLAGLLSKENVATFPVVLVLVELILFPQDLKQFLKNTARIAIIVVPPFAAYVLMTHLAQGAESVHTTSIARRLAEYYEDAGVGPKTVALTQSRVLFSYLSMILKPSWQGLPLLKAEILSRSMLNPPVTLYAVAGLTGLVGLGVALARKRPLVSFGILFFVVCSGPESLLLPQYPFCGYRAILPMAGVLIALGDVTLALVMKLRQSVPQRFFVCAVVVVAIVPLVYLCAVTVSQARRWNPLLFWKDAYVGLPRFSEDIAYRPYSDILSNYGLELIASGDYREAIAVLKQSAAIELSAEPSSHAVAGSSGEQDQAHARDDDARANLRIRGTRGNKVSALVNLGGAWKQSGNVVEAMACFRKAVEVYPRSPIAHHSLAAALKEAGKLTEAIREYRKTIELDPGFAPGYNGLGIAVEDSGDLAEAIRLYRKALKTDPGLAEAHNNLATALEKKGDVVGAITHYQQAIACNPRLAQPHNNVGILLRRLGRIRESLEHHREAVALDPSWAMAYSNLGAAWEASGDPSAALASYRKAVALKPDLPDANYALANALLKGGKSRDALKYLRKTVELNPQFMEAHANLGMALLSMGRFPEAVQSLEKALAINGEVAGLHNALGVALAQLGKRSEAIAHFSRALQIDPNDERAKQNLQSLSKEKDPTASTLRPKEPVHNPGEAK